MELNCVWLVPVKKCGQLESTLIYTLKQRVAVTEMSFVKFTLDDFHEIQVRRFSWISRLTIFMKFTLDDFHEIHAWRFSWNSRLTIFMKFTLDDFHEIHAWRFHEIHACSTSSYSCTRFHKNTTKHLAADVSSQTDGRMDGWSRR